ncbi:hypothetical protein [Streptomyces sp. MP131-18]|uniref:phage tail protein n=1 Tax=Streptomyces sp. MP131-18 TaxID=1857892 RepID=UPI00097C8D4D|nr:hypothetical protein [Streptomyces sp. MP131-18]ONK13126.1 Phage-related protein [Streptomyces sp. MP131-18]
MSTPPYGRASVLVVADTSQFRAELRTELSSAGRDAGRALDTSIRRALRTTGERAGRQIADDIQDSLDRLSATVGVQADTAGLRQSIETALDGITATVDVQADTAALRSSIDGALAGLSASVQVTPDSPAQFWLDLQRGLNRLPPLSVRVTPDLTGFDAAIRAHRPPSVTVPVTADADSLTRSLSALGSTAGNVGSLLTRGLGLSILVAQAAASAAALVQFTAALAPAAGILAAFPAVLGGSVAAFAALQLALSGVSDAFSAALTGTSEEFTQSLEQLSPAAQSAAREVRALRPAFEGLRNSVQDAFFSQLEGEITELAAALGGPLEAQLSSISGSFGLAARNVSDFLTTAQGVDAIQGIVSGAQQATRGLADSIAPVVEGFLRLGQVIAEEFGQDAQDAIVGLNTRLANFLNAAASGDQAIAWVRGALDVFSAAGTILQNVGSILRSVFQAAGATGGDLLGVLGSLTGHLAAFFNSTEGSQALIGLFQGLNAVGQALGPIFTELVRQVGTLAPALVPVFQAIGPALQGLIAELGGALGPVLQALTPVAEGLALALDALGPALEPLGEAIGAALTALSPLLPLVGELAGVFGGVLADALLLAITLLEPLIGVLTDSLQPVIPVLAEAFDNLAVALGPVAEMLGEQLAVAFGELLPLILAVLPPIAEELIPALGELLVALLPLIPTLTQLLLVAINPLIPVLPQLASLVTLLVETITPLVQIVVALINPILQVTAAIMGWLRTSVVVPILEGIIAALGGLLSAITSLLEPIASFVESVIGFFQRLYNTLVGNSIIPDLITAIVGLFLGLPGMVLGAVAGFVADIISRFAGLVPGVMDEIGNVGSRIAGVFTGAAGTVLNGVGELIGDIVSEFGQLPGMILDAIGDIGGQLADAFSGAVSGALDFIPGLAAGAIVTAPTRALIGEAGPEVVIPLTRPRRAFELAEQSGLLELLARQGVGGPTTITNHWHLRSNMTDPMVLAQHLQGQIARAAGV